MNTNKKVEIMSREQREATDAKYFERSNKILRGKYKRWAAGLTMQELENAVASFAANNAHGDNLSRREKLMQEAVNARVSEIKEAASPISAKVAERRAAFAAKVAAADKTALENGALDKAAADIEAQGARIVAELNAKAAAFDKALAQDNTDATILAAQLADRVVERREENEKLRAELADMKEQSAALVKRCEELGQQVAEEKNRRTLLEAAAIKAAKLLAAAVHFPNNDRRDANAAVLEQLRAALSAIGTKL